MISKKQKKFIGNIEIIKTKEKTGEIIISITPLMQNKHYGSEAIKRIIQYGFEKLKLEKFEINVYKNNQPAINCYKKVGFKINSENDNTYYMTYK